MLVRLVKRVIVLPHSSASAHSHSTVPCFTLSHCIESLRACGKSDPPPAAGMGISIDCEHQSGPIQLRSAHWAVGRSDCLAACGLQRQLL
ncbi:hypothetical protein V5799_032672 [Amblyomma americanum]|uniref:Uncharacterized protein n=1 Tax=Amblyomma americanum TaxID=6943 RepID=A0AAQ4DQH9_AMBAM